jgi:hypothetical protein
MASRLSLAMAVVVALVGCSDAPEVPAPTPWEEPVAGAVAVTEWTDNGHPTAPFGPGGIAWDDPQQILEAMERAFGGPGATVRSEVVGRDGDGAALGWVRVEFEDPRSSPSTCRSRCATTATDGSWRPPPAVSTGDRDLVDGACE